MTELIHCIRDGSLRLEPGAESGWYDHQTWSLEPLASPDRVPEATHLQLGDRYRRHLEDLFRGALALTRETHVKGVALSAAGLYRPPDAAHLGQSQSERGTAVQPLCPPCCLLPLRCGRCWRKHSGPRPCTKCTGSTAEGACEPSLAEELTLMERLFDGAGPLPRPVNWVWNPNPELSRPPAASQTGARAWCPIPT